MTDLIGHTIGQFQIIERIGKGGMADVYKAYQPGLDRYVAIKILPEYFLRDETFLARFQREAKAIAKLSHSHILPVHDFGQQDNLTYIVMQYVEAGTPKDMLGEPLDLKPAADIIAQVADALDYAHEQGIIHRDVKPSNVLMERGQRVLLTDFGLARMAEATTKITKTGVGVGTPEYMSPEQGQGKEVDARSDVYSLGVMLYEMLTGQVPYEADTPIAVVVKHLTAPLPLPRKINPAIPEAVERVVLKALAKGPADRFQAVGEMAEALRRAVAEAAVLAEVAEEKAVEAAPLPEPGVAPLPLVEPVAMVEVEEEAVPIWQRVPLWVWGVVGGVVLLAVVGGIFLAGQVSKPGPIPKVVVRATTPVATSAATLTEAAPAVGVTEEPTATPTPTATPLPPTPTGTPEPTPTDTPPPTPTTTLTPTPTPTETPLPPTPTPEGGRIAFVSGRDGNPEIYVMYADGSGVTNLTNNPAVDHEPSWSPDGTRIAFRSDRDGNYEIYVMNADGSGQTNLTNNPAWDKGPSWSPDGARIAFESKRDGNFEIYVMNADGSGLTRLTNNPAEDRNPSWGP